MRIFQMAAKAKLCSVVLSVLCTTLLFGTTIAAPPAEARSVKYNLDIPSQNLNDALQAFALASEHKLLYSSDLVDGKKSPALKGQFTTEQAVKALLFGTHLSYEVTSDGLVLIRAEDPPAGSTPVAPFVSGSADPPIRLAQANPTSTPTNASANAQNQNVDNVNLPDSKSKGAEKTPGLEEIVVTGTNIHGEIVSLEPVTIVTRKDIERSGVGSTGDLMALLPQNFGGGPSPTNGLTPIASENFTNGTGIDLLGLGSGATLTLVNGMRVAPSGFGTFVDVSNIPLTAIERVEVLTDGASAIYGSDAVAGVVNFILRDNYQGAETGVRYGSVTKGSSAEVRVNQTLGQVWERGGVLLTYEYLDQQPLSAADRDFSSSAPLPLDLIPSERRNSVLASGHFNWSDNVKLLADAMYSERHSSNIYNITDVISSTDATATLLTLNMALKADLGGDWRAQIANGLSRTKEHTSLTAISEAASPPSDNRSDLWTIDAHADGPLATIPGGAIRASVGIGHRGDRFDGTTTAGPPLELSLGRHSNSGFGEIRIPLVGDANQIAGVKRLDFSVAARFEDYSDVGHATDPKLNILWTPVTGLNVRAGWGKSFNVPRLELQNPYLRLGLVGDFVALGAGPFPSPFQNRALIVQDFGVNPALGPEKSTNWTAGLEWSSASPTLRAHATYFNYRYTDRIGQPATSAIPLLQNPAGYAPFIQLNPSPAQVEALIASFYSFYNLYGPSFNPATTPIDAIVRTRTTNLGVSRISGVDFGAKYEVGVGENNFQIGLNGVRLMHFANDFGAGNVNILNTIYNPVDMKLRASTTWTRGPLDSTVSLNYIGSYTDNVSMPNRHVASWSTIDARVALSLGDALRSSAAKGLSVLISVQNLLDRDPPGVAVNAFTSLGYDPTNASPLDRFVALELKKVW